MKNNQRGSALLLVLVTFATLFALLGASLERGVRIFERIQQNYQEDAALHLAEAGVEYSLHQLKLLGEKAQGQQEISLDTGTFSISITCFCASGRYEIISSGKAKGSKRTPEVVKTLRVQAQYHSDVPDTVPVVHSREDVL